MQRRRNTMWIILIGSALFIKIFSFFPGSVEKFYSKGIYPYISSTQRILFGWVPFSVGDILYLAFGILLLYKSAIFVRTALRKQLTKRMLKQSVKNVVYSSLIIYVVFNVLWGLNYNRVPMSQQMGLPRDRYSTENLKRIVSVLIGKLNGFDHQRERKIRSQLHEKRILFYAAVSTYGEVVSEYPSLSYEYVSVKPSLFSYLGNYLGFTGYYNPFSGEAQSNTTVPIFVQPFTTCHEIGHQVGYAKENEANFAAFLAGRTSTNLAFRYSVYFDMYLYAIRELYNRDSAQVRAFKALLKPAVIADIEAMRAFYRKYENPFEPVIRKLYAQYLKANEQPSGLRSYNEVVAMLVAYYRKHGEI